MDQRLKEGREEIKGENKGRCASRCGQLQYNSLLRQGVHCDMSDLTLCAGMHADDFGWDSEQLPARLVQCVPDIWPCVQSVCLHATTMRMSVRVEGVDGPFIICDDGCTFGCDPVRSRKREVLPHNCHFSPIYCPSLQVLVVVPNVCEETSSRLVANVIDPIRMALLTCDCNRMVDDRRASRLIERWTALGYTSLTFLVRLRSIPFRLKIIRIDAALARAAFIRTFQQFCCNRPRRSTPERGLLLFSTSNRIRDTTGWHILIATHTLCEH